MSFLNTRADRCQISRGGGGGFGKGGGGVLISSAYSQQALCLKQTNTGLSLLSAMALRQPTPQEQSLPKPAAQNNGATRLWNRRMRTIAGRTTMTGNKLLMMSQS